MAESPANKTAENKPRVVQTLDYCTRSALFDISAGMERYEQFLHWAIEGYRDFHFDLAKEIRVKEIDMLPYKAIDFPDDYVDWVKVGIRCGDIVKTFTHEENMPWIWDQKECEKQAHEVCNLSDATLDNTAGGWYFYNTYNSRGQDQGRLFGLGIKDNGLGYFSISREFKQFQFSIKVASGSKIYLEYIADGIKPCAVTVVNIYAAKLIKLYVHWMRIKFNRSSPKWRIDQAEKYYWDEFDRVGERLLDLTYEDVLQASRDGYMLAPYQ
ncbi:hypothetical protein LCGC14_1022950 [marine sediment metagenome]|uniref:Uncharacterized protein n=1 Tax=marine sediment metagenome TaxID=412755 RepID=A0A0F9MX04_9ZZZZ|nr:hypothetical protein [Candidatus Aminicenantes bacterium]